MAGFVLTSDWPRLARAAARRSERGADVDGAPDAPLLDAPPPEFPEGPA